MIIRLGTARVDELHERVAEVLGWQVEDCHRFSLSALAAFVRRDAPKLAEEIREVIASGAHICGEPYKPGARRSSWRVPW